MPSEWIGVIGALAGSVITLITTELIKHFGRLIVVIRDFSHTIRVSEGSPYGSGNKGDIESVMVGFTVELLNTSSTRKIIRDFRVRFYKNKECIYEKSANDESSRRTINMASRVDKADGVSLGEKEIITLSLSANVYGDDAKAIVGCNKVELTYKKNHRRTGKKNLSTKEIAINN